MTDEGTVLFKNETEDVW